MTEAMSRIMTRRLRMAGDPYSYRMLAVSWMSMVCNIGRSTGKSVWKRTVTLTSTRESGAHGDGVHVTVGPANGVRFAEDRMVLTFETPTLTALGAGVTA